MSTTYTHGQETIAERTERLALEAERIAWSFQALNVDERLAIRALAKLNEARIEVRCHLDNAHLTVKLVDQAHDALWNELWDRHTTNLVPFLDHVEANPL